MLPKNRIVAVGLLTARDIDLLGSGFDRTFPIDAAHDFDALLRAIDEADLRLQIAEGQRG